MLVLRILNANAPSLGLRLGRICLFLIILWALLGAKSAGGKPITDHNEQLVISETVLSNAHAHNDYLHEHPLSDALSCGFISIEADVHLVNNKLYLGHYFPWINDNNLLQKVYLEPFNELLSRQNGRVYPNFDGMFLLMIDIKTDSLSTCKAICDLVMQYPFLHQNPHFQIYVSGNRPLFYASQRQDCIAVDGRLADLISVSAPSNIPVISENFKRHFTWNGKGEMPKEELSRLKKMVNLVHEAGKKIRFWSIPDQENTWSVLLNAGVDLINTDRLYDLKQYFSARAGLVH